MYKCTISFLSTYLLNIAHFRAKLYIMLIPPFWTFFIIIPGVPSHLCFPSCNGFLHQYLFKESKVVTYLRIFPLLLLFSDTSFIKQSFLLFKSCLIGTHRPGQPSCHPGHSWVEIISRIPPSLLHVVFFPPLLTYPKIFAFYSYTCLIVFQYREI